MNKMLSSGFELYANCPPAFCKAVIDQLSESEMKESDSAKKLTQILSGKVRFISAFFPQ